MTDQELIDYYINLLILQYKSQAKARAHIDALVKQMIMNQIAFDVRDAFDIENATGVNLDVLGKYAGVKRIVTTFTEQVELGDDDYRLLIKLKQVKNYSKSTLYEIDNLLLEFLPGLLTVYDNKNMSMSYFMNASLGSQDLAEAFVVQNILPRPMGVQLSSLIYAADLNQIFAMRRYSFPAGDDTVGFNNYMNLTSGSHWLSYNDALVI